MRFENEINYENPFSILVSDEILARAFSHDEVEMKNNKKHNPLTAFTKMMFNIMKWEHRLSGCTV